MIGWLRGRLLEQDGDTALIDVGGVGYAVHAPARVLSDWASSDAPVEAWVSTQVREDAITLYGFPSLAERKVFDLLLTVNKVGPKVSLATLDTFSPAELSQAVQKQDITALSRIPGVGKRTAQLMALELEKKLIVDFEPAATAGPAPKATRPLEQALQGLGYRRSEIDAVLQDPTFDPDAPVEAQIKVALSLLFQR
ncbi:MAG: Holliday junction branch migration protein RuvA [Deltaproteobacteria bacterium]|nr:Holliday junction branch migration protein RuvA [Deltaproteobacteria bacterium]